MNTKRANTGDKSIKSIKSNILRFAQPLWTGESSTWPKGFPWAATNTCSNLVHSLPADLSTGLFKVNCAEYG